MEKSTPSRSSAKEMSSYSNAKNEKFRSSPPILKKEKASGKKNKRTLSIKSCDTLQEMVTCSICLEKLKKPKMLPCQHTFCLLCLQNCLNHDTKNSSSAASSNVLKLSCPQCRKETELANGSSLSSLPSNIYIQSLLDMFESDNLEKEIVRCSSCQTVCIDCIPCQHCQLTFCSLCQQTHVNKLKLMAEKVAQQLEDSSCQLLNKAKLFESQCLDLKSKIKSESQIRIQKIKKTEESLLNIVAEELDQENDDIQATVALIGTNVDEIRNKFVKQFDETTSSAEKVTLFLNMHEQATKLLSHIPKLGLTKLLFDPELFSITVDHKANSTELCHSSNYTVDGSSASTNHGRDSPDESSANEQSRYYRSKSFAMKSKIGIGILQRPAGIAVCPWSKEIYVVSMDSHKVNVFEKSGKFVKSFGSRGQNPGEFLCPFGIAFSARNKKIIVTDKWKNCINEFDEEGVFVRQMGLKGRSPGHFRSPEGVATDANGKIYVCDTGNDRIQVLDSDGSFMFEVGVKNTIEAGSVRQKSFFNEPTGVAVTPEGDKIIICDYGHHKVRIFTVSTPSNGGIASSAELSMTLGTKGQLKGQFYNPECVAIDNQGFILIGDSGNGRVQICRPDGKVIRTFGNNKGHSNGYFSWISGLAVTSDYDLIVSDFKNHCVKIF